MNLEIDQYICGASFDQFDYRLLYFRPTRFSEEQIAVGLLADSSNRVEAKFATTPNALARMTEIFGEAAVEQFQFACGELRRSLSSAAHLAELEVPSDLFYAGESTVAYTKDRSGFLSSVLASACVFLKGGSTSVVERLGSTSYQIFAQEVMGEVTRLNPFLGEQIFHHRLTMETGEVLDLPIRGRKVFGAPISFAVRDHRMRAEAYVAKFHCARRQIPQTPKLYVRAPNLGLVSSSERLDNSLRELELIAGAAEIPVVVCSSTEELASAIVRDEAA
jgi:hypothetical protein